MASFQPVRQARISEKVLTQLKQAILEGRYLPGEKLPSERELCQQFEASRVVIREAIRALELTGFVSLRQGPSGGAFVQELTLNHLSNAFMDLFLAGKLSANGLVEARLHIEPEVTRLAALSMDSESCRRLETAFNEEHARNISHATWVSRNLKIHYLLARMCGNPIYEAILTPLLDLTREMVLVVKPSQKVIHEHEDHRRIIDAVIAGSPDEAALAMRQHIAKVGDSLISLEQAYRARKKI